MIGWGSAGALLGGLLALVALAPAAWLADAVAGASEQRLLLADARGTVWAGSAVPVAAMYINAGPCEIYSTELIRSPPL